MVQGSGIHHGLRGFVGTEHYEQIRHHGRLALFVQFDDMLVAEAVERHVHHRHGTLDDLLAGGDDGIGLLAAQHHGGDFGRIGQVVDAGLDHLDAGPKAFVSFCSAKVTRYFKNTVSLARILNETFKKIYRERDSYINYGIKLATGLNLRKNSSSTNYNWGYSNFLD